MDIANLGQLGGGLGLDFDEPAPGEEKKKKSKKKDDEVAGGKSDLIHIRVQQRNGRKCITTVQGLHQDLDLKKILKALKKQECCNGTVVEDEEMGAVLQLQGDQRDSVAKFLTEVGARRLPRACRRAARCALFLPPSCLFSDDDCPPPRPMLRVRAEIVEASKIKKHGAG